MASTTGLDRCGIQGLGVNSQVMPFPRLRPSFGLISGDSMSRRLQRLFSVRSGLYAYHVTDTVLALTYTVLDAVVGNELPSGIQQTEVLVRSDRLKRRLHAPSFRTACLDCHTASLLSWSHTVGKSTPWLDGRCILH